MAISFPTTPTLNQTYTVGSKTWKWNGYAWDLVLTTTPNTAFNIYGGSANAILYQTAANVTSFITAPSQNNTFLNYQTGTGFSWQPASTTSVGNANVSTYQTVTNATTGTWYPALYNGTSGDRQVNANSALSFNAATGGFGIGTTSPSTWGKFAVVGANSGGTIVAAIVNTSGTTNTQSVLSFDTTNNGFNVRDSQIRATNNGSNQTTLEFFTSNAGTPTEKVRINHLGNVGIGTASPQTRLHVSGSDSGMAYSIFENTSSSSFGYGIILKSNYSNTNTISRIVFDYYGSEFTNSHGMNYVSGRTNFSNHYFRDSSNNVQMMISNSGNVGIGTFSNATPPSYKLDVAGTVNTGDLTVDGFQVINYPGNQLHFFYGGTSNTIIHRFDGNDYYILLSDAGTSASGSWNSLRPFSISKNGRVYIDSTGVGTSIGGNLGVGTNSSGYKLDVAGSANTGALTVSSLNITGPSANQIFYEGTSGITSFIAAPTQNNTFLNYQTGAGFSWQLANGASVGSANVSTYQTVTNTTTGTYYPALYNATSGNLAVNANNAFQFITNTGQMGIGGTPSASVGRLIVSESITPLGANTGDYIPISTELHSAGSNAVYNTRWRLRKSNTSTSWTTHALHDGVWVDASFTIPGSTTKTWWERYPNQGSQSWGDGATTGMTLSSAGALTTTSSVTASSFSGAGTGLTGTASSLNIGGNSTSSRSVGEWDGTTYRTPNFVMGTSGGRTVNLTPNTYNYGLTAEFKSSSTFSSTGNYSGLITYAPWDSTTASTGDPSYQLLFSPSAANATTNPVLKLRAGIDTTWGSWNTILHSGNYTNYALPSSGGTFSGSVTITGDLSVTGNTTFSGNTSYINVTNLKVSDSLIYLGANNYSSDLVSIGFVGNYKSGANQLHTGLFRAPSTNNYYLFTGVSDELDNVNAISTSANGWMLATLNANISGPLITATGQFSGPGTGLTGTASSLTAGLSTDVAGGGTNQILYQTATNATGYATAPTTTNTFLRWNGTTFDWTAANSSAIASANVANYEVVTNTSTGVYYPGLYSATSGNLAVNANSALSFNAASGVITASAFSSGTTATKSVFALPETGGTAQWIFLGTWNNAPQTGSKILFEIATSTGYNADISQNSLYKIYFKISNGSSFQAGSTGNFYADGIVWKTGPASTISNLRVVQVSNNSYGFYANCATYTGSSSVYTVAAASGVWNNSASLTTPSGNYEDLPIYTNLDSNNYNSYAPTLTGTGASGSWGISVTGTAADITGGAANQLLYQSGSGATTYATAPTTTNTFLRWNGTTFDWSAANSSTIASANVSTYQTVTNATTGTWYPALYNGTSGDRQVNANSALSFNAATGNLGVGTASPGAAKITLVTTGTRLILGTSSATPSPASQDAQELIQFTNDTAISGLTFSPTDGRLYTIGVDTDNSIFTRASSLSLQGINSINLKTAGGSSRLYINTSGNIGIGTTSPTYKLDVNGTANTGALTVSSLNITGATTNQIFYEGTSGVASFIAAPTVTNTFLRWNGTTFDWSAANSSAIASANVSVYQTVTNATTGTWYPALYNGTSGDRQVNANSALSFNSATGALTATSFSGAGTGLTGTASSLSIGGTALNITQYTINQNLGTGNSPAFTGVSASSATGRAGLGTSGGGNLTLGLQVNNPTPTTPYIDFNTSANVIDYDVRIQASGNNSITGGGDLNIYAATTTFSGNVNIAGVVSGTANIANYEVVATTSDATTHYPALYSSTSGILAVKTNSSLSYVPSTGALTATRFNGAGTGLTGTAASLTVGLANDITGGAANQLLYQSGSGATTFTTAPTVTNTFLRWNGTTFDWSAANSSTIASANIANYEVVTATSSSSTFYPALYSATSGNLPVNASSSLSYVPSTGALSATTFNGAGTGLTGTASSLTVGLANDISGGLANQLLYQSGAGATTFATAPITANTFLRWTGTTFDWAAANSSAIASANVSAYQTVTSTTTNATFYPGLYSSSTTGDKTSFVNSGLGFNPSTGVLSLTTTNPTAAVGVVPSMANMNGGRTYIGYDLLNSQPYLYESRFVNLAASSNVASGMTGNGYWFGMGAGDVSGRGFSLFGTSGSGLWYKEHSGTTWSRFLDSSNYTSYVIPSTGGTFTGSITSTGNISGSRLISTVATGTAPLTVSSTTLVTNLNADYLDGISSGSFLRSDATTNYSGGILKINTPTGFFGNNTSEVNTLQCYQATGGTDAFMTFHIAGDYATHFGLDGTTNDLFVGGWSAGANKYKIWHSGNDGLGSGLDADLLDGQSGAYYATASSLSNYLPLSGGTLTGRVVQSSSGFVVSTKDIINTRIDSGFWQTSSANTSKGWPETTSSWYHLLTSTHSNDGNYYSMQFAGDFYNSNSIYYRATNGNGNTTWNKIWHSGNDGLGSGLDADLLDGQNGSYYATATSLSNYLPLSGGTLTGSIQTTSLGVGTAASGTTGEIRATNQITAYYSDERLKTNISRIPNALEKLNKISGVTFNANEVAEQYGYTNKKQQIGVIAQEVEKVLPEVVVPAPFDIGTRDDGTEYSLSGENYKTVHYEKLVPLLIEAIKEQQKQIDELKSIINSNK